MTSYTLENIGAADATKYSIFSDTISSTTPGSSASNTTVAFSKTYGQVSVTSTVTGRTVIFGENVAYDGARITFPDGTALRIVGHASRGDIVGDDQSEFIFTDYHAIVDGRGGNDTISGGDYGGTFTGGPGSDTFIIYPGTSIPSDERNYASIFSIKDWNSEDHLSFGRISVLEENYSEISEVYFTSAYRAANNIISLGKVDVVVAQVGFDLFVFADSRQDDGAFDDVVQLSEVSLSSISADNFISVPARTPKFDLVSPEPAPKPPTAQGNIKHSISGNMDDVHLARLLGSIIDEATPTRLRLVGQDVELTLGGSGLTYDSNDQLVGGSVTNFHLVITGAPAISATLIFANPGVSAADFGRWVALDANNLAFTTLFAGADFISGWTSNDVLRGFGGADVIYGNGGADQIFGGDGDDVIYAGLEPGNYSGLYAPAATYLRGDGGNDRIVGGDSFDDINGNMGNDTASGGAGSDWVVGGKDHDWLDGGVDADIVYGNMGNDTCFGGDGADIVRGGKDDDLLDGGAGNDWLAGDRGSDTISGGAGADIFHTFSDAGIDRVTDFSAIEGDRVLLAPGTAYSLAQVGSDTIIDMGGGNQMVLVGVSLASLPDGWLLAG